MAKKAKGKTGSVYDDSDDDEEGWVTIEETAAPNAAVEGRDMDAKPGKQDEEIVPTPEQMEHYIKERGHWWQLITTIKQYQAAAVEAEAKVAAKAGGGETARLEAKQREAAVASSGGKR